MWNSVGGKIFPKRVVQADWDLLSKFPVQPLYLHENTSTAFGSSSWIDF